MAGTEPPRQVPPIAVVGGSGLTRFRGLEVESREFVRTPFGEPSSPLVHGRYQGWPVVFLARHGHGHTIPPHRVNYRANIWALKHAGIERVISVAAVGGIHADTSPGTLIVPDQIVDYTWGREHTFFNGKDLPVTHVDFTHPYDEVMRQLLVGASHSCNEPLRSGGVYGATQGPRFETAAEIDRLERDGVDIVGMTGMPEAALARELGIAYAAICLSVNWAAGRTGGPISLKDIDRVLADGVGRIKSIVGAALSGQGEAGSASC